MEATPFREKESNFIVRFLADTGMRLSVYLLRKCSPYAIMYTVNFDDEDEEIED